MFRQDQDDIIRKEIVELLRARPCWWAALASWSIMLVTVTERTREIGIRMAIGAKGNDVLTQFMIEAIFISFLGGLMGIAFGALTSCIVAKFGGWPIMVTSYSHSLILYFFYGCWLVLWMVPSAQGS